MISQLLFWKGMEIRKDGYIFKTEKDFVKELGLKSAQQKLAIKKVANPPRFPRLSVGRSRLSLPIRVRAAVF
jgi:hypothetical protein